VLTWVSSATSLRGDCLRWSSRGRQGTLVLSSLALRGESQAPRTLPCSQWHMAVWVSRPPAPVKPLLFPGEKLVIPVHRLPTRRLGVALRSSGMSCALFAGMVQLEGVMSRWTGLPSLPPPTIFLGMRIDGMKNRPCVLLWRRRCRSTRRPLGFLCPIAVGTFGPWREFPSLNNFCFYSSC